MRVAALFDIHGNLPAFTEIFTRRTAEDRLRPVFQGVDGLVVCGHTHMPFDRQVGTVRVVNAGSVGMPFGEPGAYWLLLGPKEFAARSVLQPPSEEEMLAAYSRVEPV